ncbi:MAG TPA: prepilin-type N-terminal cleavage/methylation domain-containing protein [Luteolibacter sp.]
MISAVRTINRKQGFTLVEIVLVLAIAAIVMGGAVGLMIYSSDERVLRNASGEIELMAKRARTIAILHQTPYALEFREGVVRLLPFAQAGMDEKRISRSRASEANPESANTDENRQFTLDGDLNLFIRRWNSEQWLGTTKRAVHVWRFDPDGLCEPISIRLTLGESSSEDTFHPLTATSILEKQQLEAR